MYSDIVKAFGSIGHWPGDEFAFPIQDVINGMQGTEIGNPQYGKAGINGKAALSFDGNTAGINLLSTEFETALNLSEGSVSLFAKLANENVWSDATLRWLFNLYIDTDNYIRIIRMTNDDCLQFVYRSAGHNLVRELNIHIRDWFQVGMSWSLTASKLKFYINGIQDATNFTITTPVSGTLTYATLGTETSFGRNSWLGGIQDFTLFDYALSPDQFKALKC